MMNSWQGKIIIGLTGNIATGKSEVRRMLERLGAFGIDADALAHKTMLKGTPGYQAVLGEFGTDILLPNGEIDRASLASIVFQDAHALATLEALIHPLVGIAIQEMVEKTDHKVIVIEAIKLIEAGLNQYCDSLWVTYSPEAIQINRLMATRGMDEAQACMRVRAQSPQEEKLKAADVVIRNEDSLVDTWQQVIKHWQTTVPFEFRQSSGGLDADF